MFELLSNTTIAANLEYRPTSYFFPMSLNKFLLGTVKGTQRRRDVENLIAEGRLLDVDDWLTQSSIDDKSRELMGRIHPAYMGGEYLPNLKDSEIEIARIELNSTTADVISIRAIQRKSRIYYSIVDEYETVFVNKPRWSKNPLTLKEIINLIETGTDQESGEHSLGLRALDEGYRIYDFDLDHCRTFTRVTSAFYAELEYYYQDAIEQWYQNCLIERELDDDTDV